MFHAFTAFSKSTVGVLLWNVAHEILREEWRCKLEKGGEVYSEFGLWFPFNAFWLAAVSDGSEAGIAETPRKTCMSAYNAVTQSTLHGILWTEQFLAFPSISVVTRTAVLAYNQIAIPSFP